MDFEIDPPSFMHEGDNIEENDYQPEPEKKIQLPIKKDSIQSDKTLITNLPKKTPSVKSKSSNKKIEIVSKERPISKSKANQIDKFEKNLNKNNFEYNFDKLNDSDYEEDLITDDLDQLTDKAEIIKRYRLIQSKLKEKRNQVESLQNTLEEIKRTNNQFMDIISKDPGSNLKDKKLIELVKKNTDLKLKIEKYKLIEKELLNQISQFNESKNKKEEVKQFEPLIIKKENLNLYNNNTGNDEETKKKLKISEAKIVEMRNKLQVAKEENTKLNILIKREIGEAIDIEKALKDKVYWKGRAEVIESLKTKIKILEAQRDTMINNSDMSINNDKSIINNNVRTPIPNSNVVSYSEYKKEKDTLKGEIDKLKEENTKLNTENSKVKLRISLLEKDVRTQKEDLTSKIRILIEKSDNDEKLILALNKELEKKGSRSINPAQLGYENPVFNLQQEINKLRADIKEKETYIESVNSMMIPETERRGGHDSQWNTQTLGKIIKKLKELEDENKLLKLESDDGKVYESLARENAKLRLRMKDLEDKLSQFNN